VNHGSKFKVTEENMFVFPTRSESEIGKTGDGALRAELAARG